jgi:hypothetical protein
MRLCKRCGGAIGEPGKAYGYAGDWCPCAEPDLPRLGDIQVIPPGVNVGDYVRDRAGITLVPMGQPSTLMTPAEFVVWLRGYFGAYGNNTKNMAQGDLTAILAKLDTLGGPK